MIEEHNSIFSFVLDSLADKPSQNHTQLFKDVKQKLKDDGIEVKNLNKQIDATINVAQDLGLLSVQGDAVNSLFQLKAASEPNDSEFEEPEPEERARRRRSRRRSGSRRRSRSRRSRRRRM